MTASRTPMASRRSIVLPKNENCNIRIAFYCEKLESHRLLSKAVHPEPSQGHNGSHVFEGNLP
jgi:hypothetical protein